MTEEVKDTKQINFNCCNKMFRVKHRKLGIVQNVNITYFGIFMFYLNKFLTRLCNVYIIKKILDKYDEFLHMIVVLSLPVHFLRIVYIWADRTDKYNNKMTKCIHDGLNCEIIKNNCENEYNNNYEKINSDNYWVARKSKNVILNCVTQNYVDENNSYEYLYAFMDTYMWMLTLILFGIILNIIFEFLKELVLILKTKIKNMYAENVPDIEELDV